ncbi:BAG family molecular chaperone regulator 2-like [Cynara cardunculus var. scolymus]|uniref:BAG domain-containing protein n=1 Tax=Cynara cardunculus var. scolymus TaxID=59895 RepID=A0A103Y908_CYNCS|nr:BAG family molecular chaperone regulator 2-like [Cynara cardunculus var. scolymus]KVI04752.1 BAG domain-containing protein [Cynara cardunculus var. scolymus]
MMRMRTKTTELTSMKGSSAPKDEGENEWEVRPGGMLVQKRDPDEEQNRIPPPTIRVRVKYRSIYHEIFISSQATFGELKKMLTGPTGLHHEDQKLMYKDKERASKTFLDAVGVKDKSKMVLVEDPISQEKRYLEARKNAKMEKAAKSVSEISLEVDRLAGQVSALESVISKGGKVAEKMVSNLIELLMNQLLKLDEIMVDGDVNLQKKMQVERVQRYVETLDVLKVKNSTAGNKGNENHVPKQAPSQLRPNKESNEHGGNHHPQPQSRRSVGKFSPMAAPAQQQEPSSKNTSGAVVVTTQWETFDSLPTIFPAPPSTSTSTTSQTMQPNFNWDLL